MTVVAADALAQALSLYFTPQIDLLRGLFLGSILSR